MHSTFRYNNEINNLDALKMKICYFSTVIEKQTTTRIAKYLIMGAYKNIENSFRIQLENKVNKMWKI